MFDFLIPGEVSIDFKVDRDTTFVVLNVRDMNVTERALFKSGGSLGPKVAKTLEYPQADQSYIEFKVRLICSLFFVSYTFTPHSEFLPVSWERLQKSTLTYTNS